MQKFSPTSFSRLFAIVLVVSFFGMGCSEQSPTGLESNADLLIEDPLDGVLNSTDGTTPVNASDRTDRLADILGLDDDQKAALSDAYQTFKSGIEALKAQIASGDLSREEAKDDAGALRDAFEAALQTVLTEDQWNTLQEMRQNRDGRGRGHKDPVERLTAALTEVGADQGQIEAVLAAGQIMHDGMKSLREQHRAGDLTKEAAMEQVKALREAFNAALQEILTPEQYAALQELRPDHRGKHPRG